MARMKEIYSEYKNKICSNCDNDNANDCEIRVFRNKDIITARCLNYRCDNCKKEKICFKDEYNTKNK